MILAPENGRASKYVPEHILVMERTLDRKLEPGEVVHHVNGEKLDNRPENLLVCTRSEHRAFHAQLEAIAYALMKEGRVRFTDTGYVLE